LCADEISDADAEIATADERQDKSADDTFRTAGRLDSLRRYDEAEPHFARIATVCESTRRGECGRYYLAEC
jgi:hypothetical protein